MKPSDPLLIALVSVALLYFLLLGVRSLIRNYDFCVICASVSMTWISLLVLFLSGKFSDSVIIALLMGQSMVGLYYTLEKRVDEDVKIFRLPFLLTLIFLGYHAIKFPGFSLNALFLVLLLWVVFLTVYFLRNNYRVRTVAKKIIECCKNW